MNPFCLHASCCNQRYFNNQQNASIRVLTTRTAMKRLAANPDVSRAAKRARQLKQQQTLRRRKQACIDDMRFALERGWTVPAYRDRALVDFHPSTVLQTVVTGRVTKPGRSGGNFVKLKLVATAREAYRLAEPSLQHYLGSIFMGKVCISIKQIISVRRRRVRVIADELCRAYLLPELATLAASYL